MSYGHWYAVQLIVIEECAILYGFYKNPKNRPHHRLSSHLLSSNLDCIRLTFIILYYICIRCFPFHFSFNILQEQICVQHLCKSWNFPSQSHLWFPLQSVSLKFILFFVCVCIFKHWAYVRSMRREQSYVNVNYTVYH